MSSRMIPAPITATVIATSHMQVPVYAFTALSGSGRLVPVVAGNAKAEDRDVSTRPHRDGQQCQLLAGCGCTRTSAVGGPTRMAGLGQGNREWRDPESTHRSRWRFSQRRTGLLRNLTFARAGEKAVDGHSGRSRMPIDHHEISGPNGCIRVTNWH